MTDLFDDQSSGLASPAAGAFAITPSDTIPLPSVPRGLYVGVGGSLTVEMKWGGVISFANVPDGSLLPVRVVKVLQASTAASIVGLY